ncbi:hypothetical protein J7E70_07865 [Variovorax paradoxus]|nr:hypothetical protein [Variovorax paradoxus]MBT2300379.1 hypothetical protein [Variovorax paradoxus]
MKRTAEEAWLLAQRLAKEALYAGVYGRPYPQEIKDLHGDYPIFRKYYDAGAAIARRAELTEQASLRSAPNNGKTRTAHK